MIPVVLLRDAKGGVAYDKYEPRDGNYVDGSGKTLGPYSYGPPCRLPLQRGGL